MILDDLRRLLKRLRLSPGAPIPQNTTATRPTTDLDALLTLYLKQGYLERSQVGESKANAKKRGRRVQMTWACAALPSTAGQ